MDAFQNFLFSVLAKHSSICSNGFTTYVFAPSGDFPYSGTEVVNPYFLLLSSACWNGVAMGCIDIAKNHVTNKRHFDRGMRVGDYPIIQVNTRK